MRGRRGGLEMERKMGRKQNILVNSAPHAASVPGSEGPKYGESCPSFSKNVIVSYSIGASVGAINRMLVSKSNNLYQAPSLKKTPPSLKLFK